MNIPVRSRLLVIIGIVCLGLIMLIGVILLRVGRSYEQGLESFTQEPRNNEVTLAKRKVIKKLTVKKEGEEGCLEITPDGAVRIFKTCGGELSEAQRPVDPKNILTLFKLVSQEDLSIYQNKTDVTVYIIIIETDGGTETYYLASGGSGGTGGSGGEIITTIELIQGDLPQPTTTGSPIVTSTPPPNSTPTPTFLPGTPSPTAVVTPGPSTTVGPTPAPFTCGFSEGGTTKPYRITNTVCSTEPTPGL